MRNRKRLGTRFMLRSQQILFSNPIKFVKAYVQVVLRTILNERIISFMTKETYDLEDSEVLAY